MKALAQLRTVVRLVLLAVLTVGVVGMHSTGHPPAGHCASDAGHGPAAGHDNPAAATSQGMRPPQGQTLAATQAVLNGPLSGCGTPGWQVCLAVLAGVGLALLAAAAVCLAAGTGGAGVPVLRAAPFGRGPPRLLLGLTMANLSVLRI